MKPKDIFKLAVRILGLVFIYHGLTALPLTAPAAFTAMMGGQVVSFILTLLILVWPLAVAYWLLRGAPLIMRIAYPDATESPPHVTGAVCEHKVDA